jgi:hypothetical protein
MNANKVRQIIITCVSLVTLIVVAAAFTVAWYLEDIADPYTFNITADGVLYVYVGSTVVDSGKSFAPAVSKAGAIREGLSYDVLARHRRLYSLSVYKYRRHDKMGRRRRPQSGLGYAHSADGVRRRGQSDRVVVRNRLRTRA